MNFQRSEIKTRRADRGTSTVARCCKWSFLGLAIWVGWHILAPYQHYVPPDFEFGFLRGKADFFYRNGYWLGFSLILPPLRSPCFRVRCNAAKRFAFDGRVFIVFLVGSTGILVLGFAAPGGLIMATRHTWLVGATCFGVIAVGAWLSTLCGWRSARAQCFEAHRRWMLRSYTLILSAVFLRLINISLATTAMEHEFTYQLSAWLSLIVPVAFLELRLRRKRPRPE